MVDIKEARKAIKSGNFTVMYLGCKITHLGYKKMHMLVFSDYLESNKLVINKLRGNELFVLVPTS